MSVFTVIASCALCARTNALTPADSVLVEVASDPLCEHFVYTCAHCGICVAWIGPQADHEQARASQWPSDFIATPQPHTETISRIVRPRALTEAEEAAVAAFASTLASLPSPDTG